MLSILTTHVWPVDDFIFMPGDTQTAVKGEHHTAEELDYLLAPYHFRRPTERELQENFEHLMATMPLGFERFTAPLA